MVRTVVARATDGAADADTVAWTRAMLDAFLVPVPTSEILARGAATFEGQRLRAVDEPGDPTPVAVLRSWDTRMTVPGGDVAVSTVTSAGVRSTHRRRGLMRRLVTEELGAAARAGTPVAALTSTQGSLYEAFGFGAAAWTRTLSLDTATARFREPAGGARVELVGPDAFLRVAPTVHERSRRRHAGTLALRGPYWSSLVTGAHLGSALEPDRARHAVLVRDDGGLVSGYAVYRVEGSWSAYERATLAVLDLQASTPQAHRELWRHLCAHDLVGTARWDDASLDDPLPWLLADHRAVTVAATSPMLWLRVLDVAAALTARTYPVADGVRLLVHDAGGHAAGRWALDTTDPTAPRVTRLEPSAVVDLELDVSALGSLYLGGADPRVLARAGRLVEHAPGAAGRLARMLAAPSAPWNGSWF